MIITRTTSSDAARLRTYNNCFHCGKVCVILTKYSSSLIFPSWEMAIKENSLQHIGLSFPRGAVVGGTWCLNSFRLKQTSLVRTRCHLVRRRSCTVAERHRSHRHPFPLKPKLKLRTVRVRLSTPEYTRRCNARTDSDCSPLGS